VLTSTFCCFDGVSVAAERRLWQSGCLSWREYLLLERSIFSARKHAKVRGQIGQAQVAFESCSWDFFLNRLKAPESIRVLPHVRDAVGYLDIETTGLAATDVVTTIALYRRGEARCFVRGINLEVFLRELSGLSMIVTYNGAAFDLPRLRKLFRIDLALPHLDLMHVLRALGYTGGLKWCETLLGISRPDSVALNGPDAVDLWRAWESRGDRSSLLALLRYNIADVVSLERLATEAFNRATSGFPMATRLTTPRQPDVMRLSLEDVL
jgi:uncharacterized protein YprB with RNaseH-like and TPR domain